MLSRHLFPYLTENRHHAFGQDVKTREGLIRQLIGSRSTILALMKIVASLFLAGFALLGVLTMLYEQ